MSSFGTMQRQQQDLSNGQPSRSYGHYIDSNPSSTHSSPRSFPPDLEPYYPNPHHHSSNLSHSQTYPLPAGATAYPYVSAQQRRPYPQVQASRSSSYSSYTAPVSLQVSTSTSSSHEHDPNERTARPGNAHVHAQFHSSLATATASSSSSTALTSAPTSIVPANAPANEGVGTDGVDGDGASAGSLSQQQQQQQADYAATTPGLSGGFSRLLKPIEQERLAHLDRLKFFLATAPSRWDSAANNANPPSSSGADFAPYGSGTGGYAPRGAPSVGGFSGLGMGLEPAYHHAPPHPALNRFLLPNQEFVTCVLWNGLYHITGTDIVRALVFRFEAFGRPVRNMKKFEEGVFSDLRNLKPGVDACLEEPKSPFLDLLFKYQCIRTQKKQKVFYWFSVPHDRLFLDALERDLKREKIGLEATTQIIGEPALSFTYDPKKSLYEQFSKAQGAREGEGELESAARRAFEDGAEKSDSAQASGDGSDAGMMMDDSENDADDAMTGDERFRPAAKRLSGLQGPHEKFFSDTLGFQGSPHYKIRRKKNPKSAAGGMGKGADEYGDEYEGRGRSVGGGDRFGSLSRERGVLHRPIHPSMRDEFAPNAEADQARHRESISAADMFIQQAKGELLPSDGIALKPKPQPLIGEVPIIYSHGGPSDAAVPPSVSGHRLGMAAAHHNRGRSFDLSRGEPSRSSSGTVSAGYTATTFAEAQQQQQPPALTAGGMGSGTGMYEAVSSDGKIRAFVCPLYSCGRLFKRMEHLKRHLRTHTMERPFTCPRCSKKFSRSDNLTQHLRTHERTGSGPLPLAGGGADWDDADVSGEGSASGGSPRAGSVADSDDDGMLQSMVGFAAGDMGGMDTMYGDGALGMGAMDMSQFNLLGAGAAGFNMSHLDATMFEVEVQGGVQDVQGDEPGLLMRTGGVDSSIIYRNPQQQQTASSEGFYSSVPSSGSSGLLFSSASGASDFSDVSGWGARPQTSAAFGGVTAPSPQTGSIIRNRSSLTSSPAGFMRNMHQSTHSQSSNSSYGEDFSSVSLSAPSHKQTFDHSTLYPPSMLDSSGGNIGPMRRHRSMTPSLIRGGESIRRPMTSNSGGEFQPGTSGSPGSVNSSISSSSGAPRGYHPYAYSNSNSRANSTHSSPQVHAVPLSSAADYAQIHRSESRNSGYGGTGGLHEQMRQMMHMSIDPTGGGGGGGAATATGNAAVFGEAAFRSGSPASFHQTESPATFSMDLPMQFAGGVGYPAQAHQQILHAATMPAGSQFANAQAQQQQFEGYYGQHATL